MTGGAWQDATVKLFLPAQTPDQATLHLVDITQRIRTPNPGFFRTNPVQSRTQNTFYCLRMPIAKDQAIAPLPSPQRDISHVFIPVPTFSGNHQRTSIIQQLLHVTTYTATIIAVWTIVWTRRDAHSARFHRGSTHPSTKHSITITQLVAVVRRCAVEDCQHPTTRHRTSVHMPEPTVVQTISRPYNCISQV